MNKSWKKYQNPKWSHSFCCCFWSTNRIVSTWMWTTIFDMKVKPDRCLDLVLHCIRNRREVGQWKTCFLCNFHLTDGHGVLVNNYSIFFFAVATPCYIFFIRNASSFTFRRQNQFLWTRKFVYFESLSSFMMSSRLFSASLIEDEKSRIFTQVEIEKFFIARCLLKCFCCLFVCLRNKQSSEKIYVNKPHKNLFCAGEETLVW